VARWWLRWPWRRWGWGGCASVSPENNKHAEETGFFIPEVSEKYDAAYKDASPNNDAVAYAIVHSGRAIVPGFSVSDSNQKKFIEAMHKSKDIRLTELDQLVFVKAMMLKSPAGGVPSDALVPKDVAAKLKSGDIIKVHVPNSSRPAYFVEVASHECHWDGSFYYGIYTAGGTGVVCQNGWNFKTDLPLQMSGLGFTHTMIPGPGSAIVKARKAAEANSK
jgi:hypothetical protein